jgi:hypothetical protein
LSCIVLREWDDRCVRPTKLLSGIDKGLVIVPDAARLRSRGLYEVSLRIRPKSVNRE